MSDRIIQFINEALRPAPEGMQFEVLERAVADKLGHPVARGSLRSLLVRNSNLFVEDAGGRWRLRVHAETVEPEDGEPAAGQVLRKPLTRGRFVVFDLETLGREAAGDDIEIIEIACARYEGGRRVDTWQTFVRPSTSIPKLITELTTITDDDVSDAPGQREALEEFFRRTASYPLIAHNGFAFDGVVLRNVATRVGLEVPADLVLLDTLPLARLFLQGAGQRHNNEALAEHYGSFRTGAHRADADVEMLCGTVEGLIGETNRHPAGALIYELLRRSGEPWADLLDPPQHSFDLEAILSLFGGAQKPLLPTPVERRGALGASAPIQGAEEGNVNELFEEMARAGRERREPQIRFAQLGAEALRSGRFAVVEAGTGTGKSLGYLVPAALHARAAGMPVVISTYSKVLQTQLVEKDVTYLSSLLPDLTAAVLKGRGNYLSIRRLREEIIDAVDEDRISRARAWTLGTLTSFSLSSETGELESVSFAVDNLDEYLDSRGEALRVRDSVRASAGGGGGQPERPAGGRLDFYEAARENASRADLIILNHSLLLTQAVMAGDRLPELLSPFVVCDEAHNLEDAATSVLKNEVTEVSFRRLLRAVHDKSRRAGLLATVRKAGVAASDEAMTSALGALADVETHFTNLSTRLRSFVVANTIQSKEDLARFGAQVEIRPASLQGSGGGALRESALALREALFRLRPALDAVARRTLGADADAPAGGAEVSRRRSERAIRLARFIIHELTEVEKTLNWFWTFAEATAYVRVIGLQPERYGGTATWTLEGSPIDVSALLYERLWSRLGAGVFCSATLATYGDGFGFFLRRTGVGRLGGARLITEILPHVFDYKSNALLALPAHLPTPRDEALKELFPQAIANEMLRFIPHFHGRTLGLFTARSRMHAVHEQVEAPLREQGYPVLRQGDGALDRLRQEFEGHEATSLFGVRSLWEGIDVPGASLSFVFMSKMPFPSLGDPLEAARNAAVERAGGNSFYDYFLPRTIFTFKQGFGRLLRSETDRGAVILFDKRLRGATYRPDVLQSLPAPTISYDSDVEMYRRISEWMGEPFDESLLAPLPLREIDQLLAEHTLAKAIYTEEEFEEVVLPHLRAVLKGVWGFDDFRPDQLNVIRHVLTGHDLLALYPTGAGKSLTFQLPALIRPGLTLVISPLIALIRDQVQKLRHENEVGFVNCLVSGMTAMEQEEVLSDARSNRLRILYASPERLRDPRFRAFLADLPIVQLVIDEAHCISTWGHDFRPDFLEITSLLPAAEQIPIQALTATATTPVRAEIKNALRLGDRGLPLATLVGDFRRDNLVFRVFRPQSGAERDALAVSLAAQIVGDAERGGAGIIYVATRREAERIAGLLRARNIAAQPYHAGLPTPTRHHIQELFMQGEIQVVVATNAFGMGVDKQEIRFVLHYDHPSSVEAYVQESGRAGRDGREAYAILLYSKRTQGTHRFLARQGVPSPDEIVEVARQILNPAFDGALRLTDGTVHTSMESLVEELGFEDTKLRVIIHALEGSEILKRGEDFALEATVLLNRPSPEIVRELSGEDKALFEILSEAFGFAVDTRSHYNSLQFVRATSQSPSSVDRLLHRLALKGDLIYRSFARGSSFAPGERALDSRAVRDAAGRFQDRLAQFTRRLKDIIRYAELGSDRGHCRAKFLVEYLTGAGASSESAGAPGKCGKCDLCAPGYPLPWSQAAVIAPEPLQVEPTMAILEMVRDHETSSSINTLIKMLLGEAFGNAGGERYSLSAYARNSEHFGVLRGRSSHVKLKSYFDALTDGGYIAVVERQSAGGGTYRSVRLTDRGRDVLAGAVPAPGSGEPITVEDAT
ncbi:MAG TPA: RecQ family ATP-dependent DNA helicase [Pyrinomonadaceae bacterium]|nr:RecQ family ATP-dependent DNA helicase [Pyrinomonadaceae bacterium]